MNGTLSGPAGREALRRLMPALLISAIAHLALLQSLPRSVRPHDDAFAPGTALTVVIERATPKPPVRARPVISPATFAASAGIQPAAGSPPPPAQPYAPFASASAGAFDTARSKPLERPLEQASPPALIEARGMTQSMRDASYESSIAQMPTLDHDAVPLLDYYYDIREVDQPARAVGDGLLEYPREALKLRLAGKVKLRLFIDASGTLVRSEVVEAQPRDVFEQAAREAVHTMQFLPARKAEQPVRSQRTVEITFDPDPDALRHPSTRR